MSPSAMLRSRVSRVALAVAAGLLAARTDTAAARAQSAAAAASACGIETTDRVVAVGDVHGAYDRFAAILREAGLIDQRQRWTGGKTVFVQTGDILDRGADSRRALDLLKRLEPDAAKAGGRVVPLLGNHEVMRMLGDMRYVSAGEYAAFKTSDASDLLEKYYNLVLSAENDHARAAGQRLDEREFRRAFLAKTPLGAVEMQLAFAPDGEYGKWLRTHDTMAIVNGIAFLHGGTTAAVAALGCRAMNDSVRTQLKLLKLSDPAIEKSLLAGADGPLWYRGLVDDPPAVDDAAVTAILNSLNVKAMVVGHTVAAGGKMRSTFGGRVIQIDTGMLGQEFYPEGAASALEIKDGTLTAIYVGHREVIARSGDPSRSTHR